MLVRRKGTATRHEIQIQWQSGVICWFNAGMDLSLLERDLQGFHIIEVSGEIDVYTAPKLREVIVAAIDRGNSQLIVDIEKVAFLDSTGLGVLVGALKRVRADNGSLDIVCTSERLLRIFDITGLDRVFQLHRSVDDIIK